MDNPHTAFTEAKAAIEQGDKTHARILLDGLLALEPNNEPAWLLLAEVVDHENERADCLCQALAINPHNQATQQEYDDLLRQHPELVKVEPAAPPDSDPQLIQDKFDKLYDQAYQATLDGHHQQAESQLDELVAHYPDYEAGWLLLSQIASDPEKAEKCLRRVVEINPEVHLAEGKRLFVIAEEKEKENLPAWLKAERDRQRKGQLF